ncbi:uncharacterized protein TNCV_958761 [Trichonephila clavipes]|nr:uncharacterized protein TNCV_958761 [Trichonephila clavipes]
MIHNRRAIINPFSEGSSLQSGAQYNVYVSQTTKERLPAPYDTDCVDYLAMWRENNGTGPLDHMASDLGLVMPYGSTFPVQQKLST